MSTTESFAPMDTEIGSRLSQERVSRLEEALQKCKEGFPAVAIALVDTKGLLHAAASGSIGGESASPSRCIFPVASISKTIVAGLCLQCSDRRELDLDKDVNEFLPSECAVYNPSFPDKHVTPRHLLTHRSGLCDDESPLYPGIWRTEGVDCETTLAEYVHRRLNPASDMFEPWLWSRASEPGAAPWHYSNAGFAVLGLALETVSGVGQGGLQQLARDRLFRPLEMSSSSFLLAPLLQLPDAQLALPHGPAAARAGASPAHYGVCEYPAAGLRSTALDLARWLRALVDPGSAPAVLSAASLEEMLPQGEHCEGGLAWWGSDASYGNRAGRTWEHGGFMEGVRSHIYIWPRRQVGAVLMGNGEGSYKALEFEIRAALAEHLGVRLSEL